MQLTIVIQWVPDLAGRAENSRASSLDVLASFGIVSSAKAVL